MTTMADFRYRVNNGPWVIVENATLPYVVNTVGSDIIEVQPIGSSQMQIGLDGNRVVEIAQMTGSRVAVVPQTYIDAAVADAFNPDNHSVGDPLIPTCSIYTHKAIRSGNWSDPTMWDVGTTPHSVDGTSVVCSGEYDITYDVLSNVRIKDIHINGRGSLTFPTNIQTRLWVDTIMCDGKLIMGQPGAPILDSGIVVGGKRQPQCEVVFWQSEAPLKTSRLGLNTMGPVRIQGAYKDTRLFASNTLSAGSTTITLDEIPTGWKVGDEILIPATESGGTSSTDPQYLGPMTYYHLTQTTANSFFMNVKDDVRTITAINGNVITLNSPLTYDHIRYTRTLPRGQVVDLKPIVAILTHSIRFRTADSSDTAIWVGANLSVRQKRAHMMFMLNDDVEIRYAESKNMGRTDTDPSLADPNGAIRYTSSALTTPITDVNNVRGRYPWHIHRTGAYFGRKQVVLRGVSSWAPPAEYPIPGWAITHHDSRAAIEDCVVYNVRGAGIVSELGNETGQWINNTVAWCRGDGHIVNWAERAEEWTNHNGHMGAAYENQARQILQQGNTAHSSRIGWMVMQQVTNMLSRIPDGDSLRYRDPLAQGGRSNVGGDYSLDNETYGIEQAQFPDFFDNHVFGCGNAFWRSHVVNIDRYDKTPFIFKRYHSINCGVAYQLINYTYVYYFYDCLWIGASQASSSGGNLGPVSWEHGFVNMRLERMATGFLDAGHSIAYQTYWIDVEFGAGAWGVTTPFNGPTVLDFGADPTTRPTYGIMGPWTVTGATTARPRTWASISAANLPQPYPLAPFGPDQTFRDANPCPSIGQAPYVVVDPTSDLTISPTGAFAITIKANVVDSVGYRRFGDNQTAETNLTMMTPRLSVSPEWATGTSLARRNGVFNDNGTWKMRMWFNDLDRYTGDHFKHAIDITLVGFDNNFLIANTVDPMATKPPSNILPELIVETQIGANEAPVIVTAMAFNNIENELLAIPLKANTALARWSITGGADAADFEITYVTNQWVLRWTANGTKDFEVPDDIGVNNVYDVQVTCTTFAGMVSTQTISVTVTNQLEDVVSFFDDFASPSGQFLDERLGYVRVSGPANRLSLSGGQVRHEAGTGATVYRLPNIGLTTNFIMRARLPNGSNLRVRAGVIPGGTGPRLQMYKNSNTSLLVVEFTNTAGTTTSWNYTNPNSDLITLELVGTTFRVLVNSVERTSSNNPAPQVIDPLDGTARMYLSSDFASAMSNVLDDLYIGPV